MSESISDLRSAIDFYKNHGGTIVEYSSRISPELELANHYIQHGAGIPTINNIVGDPILYTNPSTCRIPILMGLLANRTMNNLFLLGKEEKKENDYLKMISTPLAPIKIENPICQEKRIEDVDLLKQLPIPIFSSIDAGPYITMGLVYAKGRKNGEVNCSVHRFCIHGKDTMSIWMTPTRHLTKMYNEAISLGESLPISINIGLDPAIYFASCFSDPFLQYGENELYLAGSIRKSPVLISECLSVKTDCISNAEIVIEAEITNQRVDENSNSQYEFSFGEFLGYHGHAQKSIPLVKAKMITHRNDPLYQSVLGPGYEQSELLGIAAETTIYSRIIRNIDIELKNVYYSPVGGGLLFLVIQIKKNSIWDDTKVRQVGLLASSETMVKHIMLVDEDVNVYSADELLWALTTRFQVEKDLIQINNMPGFPADPTQSPEYLPALSISGTTSKLIFDCTVPYKMKNKFKRSFN